MLDMKVIRENTDLIKESLKNRKSDYNVDKLLEVDEKRRELLQKSEMLKKEKNEQSGLIGKYKREGIDASEILNKMGEVSEKIKELDQKISEIEEKQNFLLLTIPNKLHETTPVGASEDDNKEVRKWGEPKKFDFTPKPHDELGVELDILDFERGTKLGGSRFTVYKGMAARLERALINFMLDTHTSEHGYQEMLTPQLVKKEIMVGTGQLPKFEEDAYKTTDDMYLIPTAEVTLTNLHREEIDYHVYHNQT